MPVSELIGDKSVADAWPAEHRRSVPETRPEWLESVSGEDLFWLIRSPWPSISIADAFSVIWGYVHPRAPSVNHRIDPDQQRVVLAEFASLDENYVASLIAAGKARNDD